MSHLANQGQIAYNGWTKVGGSSALKPSNPYVQNLRYQELTVLQLLVSAEVYTSYCLK